MKNYKYFGKIKKADWQAEDFVRTTKKGKVKHYYYLVEVGSEDIWLTDTCGRGLPIDLENLSYINFKS